MAVYNLDVKLQNVDLITGVTVSFAGKVKGNGRPTVFAQSETPFKGSLGFRVRGNGDRLIGTLSFSSADGATFVDQGVTYNVITPATQKVRIDDNKSTEIISVNFSKASPRTALGLASSALEAQNVLDLVAAVDPFLG